MEDLIKELQLYKDRFETAREIIEDNLQYDFCVQCNKWRTNTNHCWNCDKCEKCIGFLKQCCKCYNYNMCIDCSIKCYYCMEYMCNMCIGETETESMYKCKRCYMNICDCCKYTYRKICRCEMSAILVYPRDIANIITEYCI